MSLNITLKDFTTKFINNCPIVRSSRLDKTIKAIINTYTKEDNYDYINYLNKIRIIYYLKRLEYKNPTKAKTYKGKDYLLL